MTSSIEKVRQQVLLNRKILCTGNPNRKNTIASGIQEIWPDAKFMYKSNGFDLSDSSKENIEKITREFLDCTTFINASYISHGVQPWLLDLFFDTMPIGEIFNIGSTHEYDGLGGKNYKETKTLLRDKSFSKNNFRINSTHIVLGSIYNDTNERWIKPIEIAQAIKWVTEQRFKVPLLGIDQPKDPW